MRRTSLESLFLRAWDLELASGRWFWCLVGLLLLFHSSIVTPFVASSQRREAASQELRRLEGVKAELEILEPRVALPAEIAQEVMGPALDQLIGDVGHGLLRVRATQRSLRELIASQRSRDQAPTTAAEEDASVDPSGNDEPAEEKPEEDDLAGIDPFPVENIDRILAIAEAETRDEMLAALTPLVEEKVVHPLYSDLEQLWLSSAVPRVEATLDGIAGRIPELRGQFTDAAAAWEDLANALVAQRRAVRDLVWEPPEREDWWVSASTSDAFIPRLDIAVEEQLRRPLALDQFEVTAARLESDFRSARIKVDQRFEELRLEVESGGLPEIVSRLGMARLARSFPGVLGVSLALLVLWGTRRRRGLGVILHLLIRQGHGHVLLEWFCRRCQWGLSETSADRGLFAVWRTNCLRIFMLAAVGFAWIGFSAAQLWDIEPPEYLLALTVIGAAALLVALVYDFTVARQLHVLLINTVPDFPDDSEIIDIDESSEPINGHTLKR